MKVDEDIEVQNINLKQEASFMDLPSLNEVSERKPKKKKKVDPMQVAYDLEKQMKRFNDNREET